MFAMEPGRRAVITGGASGFGFEIARKLKALGVAVAIADINAEQLRKAGAQLGVATVEVDVTKRQSVFDGIAAATNELGGLDTLVNSAGIFHYRAFADISEADWDRMLNINLRGTLYACQAAMGSINASGRGRIVSISSTSGLRGGPLFGDYAASKFGVIGLMQSLALECGPYGTTVNSVCPGGVPSTGMGKDITKEKERMQSKAAADIGSSEAAGTPMRRLGTPADIADSVLFLLSQNASWITGHALVVDGGQSLA